MSKTAFLVGFAPMTRIIADVPNVLSEEDKNKIIKAAINKILAKPEDYITIDNCDTLEEDKECPYETISQNHP